MKKQLLVTAGAIALTPSTLAHAGPLGINMGDRIVQEGQTKEGFIYEELPEAGGFSHVVKYGTNMDGVCLLRLFEVVSADDYGTQIRNEYDRVKRILIGKYGQPTEIVEYLRYDALWDEPREWSMSIAQGDRVHGVWWDLKSNEENLLTIELGIYGDHTSSLHVDLQYWFTNKPSCEKNALTEQTKDF